MGPLGVSLSAFLLQICTLQEVLELVLLLLQEVGAGCVLPFLEVHLCWGKGLCLAANDLRCSTPTCPVPSPLPSQQTQSQTFHSAQPPPASWIRLGPKNPLAVHLPDLCPAALTGSKPLPQSFPLAGRAAVHGVPAQHSSAPLLESLSGHSYCSRVTVQLSPKSQKSLTVTAGCSLPPPPDTGACKCLF